MRSLLHLIRFTIVLSALQAACALGQQVEVARRDLPDARSWVQAAQDPQSVGTLTGTIRDVNGGLVQGAKVSATPASGSPGVTANTDSTGHFVLSNLPAGVYKVLVQAPGLQSFAPPDVTLQAGEQQELTAVALAIASTTADVSVVATPDQIAVAQVHAQEKQRAFGFIPNFYTSYIWTATRMPARQKFGLAAHSAFDPVSLVSITAIAGAEQWRNTYPGYGDDAAAFGKRYAAAFGDELIGRYLASAVFPSLLHQDPRYFYKGAGTNGERARYAVTRTFITRGDDGRTQPNYSLFLGRLSAAAIANLYHPASSRGIGFTLGDAFLNIGGHVVDNLFREFILRRITPNVPAYANGENSPSNL